MRDASFRAPPSRNFAQRILDKNLKPFKHVSNLWKDRERLQKMELDPDYIRNRGFASKGKAPRNSFGYNMIVNPGHKTGDSYVQFGYDGGVRDRAMGVLASSAMIGGGAFGLSGKAAPALKKLDLLRKVGVPLWTAAGGIAAADAQVGKFADLTKTRKRDFYKKLIKDIFPMNENKYTDFSRNVGKAVGLGGDVSMPDKKDNSSGSILRNPGDNSTEANIKKYLLGLGLTPKNKKKEGPLSFIKQLGQNTNPGYLLTNQVLKRIGNSLTDSSAKVLESTPMKKIIEDVTTGNMSRSGAYKMIVDLVKSGEIPENAPGIFSHIIESLSNEDVLKSLSPSMTNGLPRLPKLPSGLFSR